MWQGLLESDTMCQASSMTAAEARQLRDAVSREPSIAPTLRDAWKELVGLDV
eukprot:SAG31_NODE_7400_length_1699_cov_2.063125_2_plen_52_part_00